MDDERNEAEDPAMTDGLEESNDYTADSENINHSMENHNSNDDDDDTYTEKKILEQNTNKAPVLNRTNILIATGVAFVVLMLISAVIIPSFKIGKKSDKKKEAVSAGGLLPQGILSWDATSQSPAVLPSTDDYTYDVMTDDEIEHELKTVPYAIESKPQTTYTSSQYSYSSAYTVDSRLDEQQKAVVRMPISDVSTTSTNRNTSGTSGNVYGGNSNLSSASSYNNAISALNESISSVASNLMNKNTNTYASQNGQDNKIEFANLNSGNVSMQWNGEYSLDYGTIIPAALITGINTDLPGMVIARVTSNIYSSQGRHLLIPAGTRIFATYNSSVTYAQDRVQIAWNKMIRPDGLEVDFGNFTGVDAQGYSGYDARRNEHPFEYLKALGLIAAFSFIESGVDCATNSRDTSSIYTSMVNTATDEVYKEFSKVTGKMVDRALDIQPTLTIEPGTIVNIITNVSMVLPVAEQNTPQERYVRTR